MSHTVLLVDDDSNVLDGLVRVLRQQPYQIVTARSGEEAIWVLKTREVDVIVADEQMPGMLGTDLLAWVAGQCPQVMRIMLTGHAAAATAIRAINEGAVYHFFTKPCDEVQLAITIRKAIEHKDLLAENRRLLELSRQQVRELERLTLDREFQARIISQDVQEPLRQISAACRRLAERCGQRLDGEAHACLTAALEAAAEMQRVLASLGRERGQSLDFSVRRPAGH